jgi:plastocyanin
MQRLIHTLRAGVVTLILATCTSDRTPAGPDTPDDGVVVIRLGTDLRFNPSDVTVPAGTTIRWVNDAAMFHTITPDNAAQDGVWARRGVTASGEAFTHTFSRAGETYTYHCEPHLANGMTGTIRVQ